VSAVAPAAPGRLGEAVEPAEMAAYLTDLTSWRDRRRAELDELDRAALASAGQAVASQAVAGQAVPGQAVPGQAVPDQAGLTGDITLSMALWQAVAARLEELERVWDGGRVGDVERRRLASLIWGRLDPIGAGGGPAGDRVALAGAALDGAARDGVAPGSTTSATGMSVSVPEACRLSDALAGQLRLRLSPGLVGLDLTNQLRALRAGLERIRDQLGQTAPGQTAPGQTAPGQQLRRLIGRLDDVTARAGRGADVGGLVPSLAADAARLERDLIVGAATRRDAQADLTRARRTRDELLAKGAEVLALVETCVAQVDPAPHLAVPQVQALGPVPAEPAAVDAYLARLDAVARALGTAEQAYRAALAERDDLRQRLAAYQAKAEAIGRDDAPEVAGLYLQARAVLDAEPTDLARSRAVVAAYQTLLGVPTSSTKPSGRTS
jgi:hypothetical protein